MVRQHRCLGCPHRDTQGTACSAPTRSSDRVDSRNGYRGRYHPPRVIDVSVRKQFRNPSPGRRRTVPVRGHRIPGAGAPRRRPHGAGCTRWSSPVSTLTSAQEGLSPMDGECTRHLDSARPTGSHPANDQVDRSGFKHMAQPHRCLFGRGARRRSRQHDDDVGLAAGQQTRADSNLGVSAQAVDQLGQLTVMINTRMANRIAATAAAADRDRTTVTLCRGTDVVRRDVHAWTIAVAPGALRALVARCASAPCTTPITPHIAPS